MHKPIGSIRNAQIKKTMLGRESHGIFSAYLSLDYGNSNQTFGGYELGGSTVGSETEKNQSCRFGIRFLLQILAVFEVEDWEHLIGIKIRVDQDGLGGHIHGVGHFLKDQWFYPADLAKEFFPEDN